MNNILSQSWHVGALVVLAGLVAPGSVRADKPETTRSEGKPSGVIQVELSKLPPDLAQQLKKFAGKKDANNVQKGQNQDKGKSKVQDPIKPRPKQSETPKQSDVKGKGGAGVKIVSIDYNKLPPLIARYVVETAGVKGQENASKADRKGKKKEAAKGKKKQKASE